MVNRDLRNSRPFVHGEGGEGYSAGSGLTYDDTAPGHKTALIDGDCEIRVRGLAARDPTPSALGLLPKLRDVFAQPTGDGAGFLAC